MFFVISSRRRSQIATRSRKRRNNFYGSTWLNWLNHRRMTNDTNHFGLSNLVFLILFPSGSDLRMQPEQRMIYHVRLTHSVFKFKKTNAVGIFKFAFFLFNLVHHGSGWTLTENTLSCFNIIIILC